MCTEQQIPDKNRMPADYIYWEGNKLAGTNDDLFIKQQKY